MRTNCKSVAAALCAIFMALRPAIAQYKTAVPGYRYAFPRDYFNHPDYQTEWWYYTGNLQSADGRRFGFELTFFRSAVTRDPSKNSAWDVRDLYLAHFAVSDLDGKKFFHAERTNRAGPGIAGADEALQKVWNGNWSVAWSDGQERLTAPGEGFAISISLLPQKPPIVHGENGVSQKSAGAGRASHYFSETRLQASGSLVISKTKYDVTGSAWMDHEFFTHQLASDQVGWDWFSLQLEDNSELMLFQIRRKDGSIDPFSAGTYVDAQGRARHLKKEDFELTPKGTTWSSAHTHAVYPIQWVIRVPSLKITLDSWTTLPSQEFATVSEVSPSYWEGAIFLHGATGSKPLGGSGYLEMTGYDHPVVMP
jgi:predicted secreted hydrolase